MKKKIWALLTSLCMVVSLSACSNTEEPAETTVTEAALATGAGSGSGVNEPTPIDYDPIGLQKIAEKTYGTDYVSLYEQCGKDITIQDVYEDPNTGLPYIEYGGLPYDLGLDFLSMAMVYNTVCPEFGTEEEVFAEWWKYYIARWNYLLPEIPLYDSENYCVYNTQIGGINENPLNTYWGAARAVLSWTSYKEDNSVIMGNSNGTSGLFRNPYFGKASAAAFDFDIECLTSGLETVVLDKEGNYRANDTVVKSLEAVDNEDGSRTYTIEIYDDMRFSDGSPITAKNYLYKTVAFSTGAADEAAGLSGREGISYTGFEEFKAYDGTNDGSGAAKVFSGLRLLGDYEFSVTVSADCLPYFYAITYAAFTPCYKDLWLGGCDIADDGEGVYITGDFYEKNNNAYTYAKHIKETAQNTDETYPYSGAYVIESFDKAEGQVVLRRNEFFKGDYEGTVPSVDKIIYEKTNPETELQLLQSGNADVLIKVSGSDEINEAVALVQGADGQYGCIGYSYAGYSKLSFRSDLGAAQFDEVRRAIAYCIDREGFAKELAGDYGNAVNGPYFTDSSLYKTASEQGMQLNSYQTSVDYAIAILENNGWIFDENGDIYTEGVRYKRIAAQYASETDKSFVSVDGAYRTVQIGDYYYMPLVINWYGIEDDPVSALLVTAFAENENLANAGIAVQYTMGELSLVTEQLYQNGASYNGTPLYNCFSGTEEFAYAAYDYACSLSPNSIYADYRTLFYIDEADIFMIG